MSHLPTALPEVIAAKLTSFERKRKRAAILRGLGEALLVFGSGTLAVIGCEWALNLQLPERILLSALNYGLATLFLLYRIAGPILKRRPRRKIAGDFERAAGNFFHERILSAVEMADAPQPGVSPWMVEQTIRLATEEISVVNPVSLVDLTAARRAWKRSVGLLLAFTVACLAPGFLARTRLALYPHASTARLAKTLLTITPGSCRLKQGMPLEIKVDAEPLPDLAKLAIKWEDGFQELATMSRTGTNGFVISLPPLSQGFNYTVRAGDAESEIFTVKVDRPPRLAGLQALVEPPAYTGWTNRLVEGGSADFLLGSRLRLAVETADEQIASAEWIPENGASLRFRVAPPNTWPVSTGPSVLKARPVSQSPPLVLDLQPTNPVSYRIRLTGANELISDSAQRWDLRPLPDEPPSARLTAVGADSGLVQRDEVLPLEAQCGDDVGLKRVDLIVLSREAEADIKPVFPLAPGGGSTNQGRVTGSGRELKASLTYNLADLNLLSGEELQFQLVATDVREQTTRSEPVSLTIGAADKAREAELAQRLRQIVSAIAEQVGALQQTRSSWLSLGRNYREEEPGSQRPAFTLLKSRLDEFGQTMALIGARLAGESETNNPPEARLMYRLGTTLSAWGSQQRDVLLRYCGQLDQAKGTNVFHVFDLGRELFGRAVTDLEDYQRVVSVLQGVFETDVLATRCESAQGRYKRGLPVLRGEQNVIGPLTATGSGLLATFLEGVDLNGKILEQKIDLPRFDNYAPAGRRDQWSCRYDGDLNIPEAGDWTLACVADDGVRLVIDGKSVLPSGAWAAHAATQYQAELKLLSGWHAIRIEFFQGSSVSKLQLLLAKKGQTLQEVPLASLRPPSARRPERQLIAGNPVLNDLVKDALKTRVKTSLNTPASVPPALAPWTNIVRNDNLARVVQEKWPASQMLATNLLNFASWKAADSQGAEARADELTGLSKEGQRILREELEKYRWRYEGAAALKQVQNAIQELREINNELRQQPHHASAQRTEQEQSKIDLAQAWEKELQRAATEAAHNFFETAKAKDATLAERTAALSGATKTEKELQPAVETLARTLEENRPKDEMAGRIDQQLNELNNRYRELNDLQERINREQVAAEARKALPPARAFARAQRAGQDNNLGEKHDRMKQAVANVERAQRVIGDYSGAERLESLAGHAPEDAKGKETFDTLRGLAMQTDGNPPSLAQTIPPPMQEQTQALQKQPSTAAQAAQQLAKPRLGMALEASRLYRQGDRQTAAAYELLGEDTGALLDSPANLNAGTLRPLAERAAALAGQKGEEARQAEIRAANARLAEMAQTSPADEAALAHQLDELSAAARQAADNSAKRRPVATQLGETAKIAQPVSDWTESADGRQIAASAANEALTGIEAAPNQWDAYNDGSQILADAARQIRADAAVNDLANLNPYPTPEVLPLDDSEPAANRAANQQTKMEGPVGQALIQPAPKGLDQAEWARLNERLRQAIRSSGIENFSEEQQTAIRAYFEKLSSDNQRNSSK